MPWKVFMVAYTSTLLKSTTGHYYSTYPMFNSDDGEWKKVNPLDLQVKEKGLVQIWQTISLHEYHFSKLSCYADQ